MQFSGVGLLMNRDAEMYGNYKFQHGEWTPDRNYGQLNIQPNHDEERNYFITASLRLSNNDRIYDFPKKL